MFAFVVVIVIYLKWIIELYAKDAASKAFARYALLLQNKLI